MIAELNEPVKYYREQLKVKFRLNAAAAFEEFIKQSKVDVKANVVTVAAIRKLEKQVVHVRGKLGWLKFFRNTFILLAITGGGTAVLYVLPFVWEQGPYFNISLTWAVCGAGVTLVSLYLIFGILNSRIGRLNKRLQEKHSDLKRNTVTAWTQMEPLNRLFQWDTVARIVMKTCPFFTFDNYFSLARLDDLCRNFHWDGDSLRYDSVLFCQSGALNGNPFVFADILDFHWGSCTYSGSLTISWRERESYYDSKGRLQSRWVTRHQVLTASIKKPKPEYGRKRFLVYGHEAAPGLMFSRSPSGLADAGDGFFGKLRKKTAVRALRRKARSMKSEFTVMANEEFDASFAALDRNDEQQFRLLFTPLAQQEMLNLLKDHKEGFGDDFVFHKTHMINTLVSARFSEFDFTASPSLFRGYDLMEQKQFFHSYCCQYFRHVFFSFAPFMTIPLYLQSRSSAKDGSGGAARTASFWEHEAIANYHGAGAFRHPESVTENILKTEVVESGADGTKLLVTAHGFKGVERVTYISVYGGDGRYHPVPVPWIEYLPVSRTTPLIVKELQGMNDRGADEQTIAKQWRRCRRKWGVSKDGFRCRKSILSFIPENSGR